MSLALKNNHFKYFTGLFAGVHYYYYSVISNLFNFDNFIFIILTTILSYEYLRHKKINYLFLALTIVSFIFLEIDNLVGLISAGVITACYELKLRKITLLKPISIALSWTLIINFYSLNIYAESFLLILALTLPFDIRDYYDDKKKSLMTLATKYRPKIVKIICIGLWIGFCVLKINREQTYLVTLLMSIAYALLLYLIRPKSSRVYTYIYLDSILLVQGFSICLKSLLE